MRTGNEHACSTVTIIKQRRHFILYRYISLVAVFYIGVHFFWHATNPLQQVKLVRRLIYQNTAAFAAPCRSPFALLIITLRSPPCRNEPVRASNCANIAIVDYFLQLLIERVAALVKDNSK
ncbi:hypothetical protein D3C78_1567400 [compost metagenome]